MVACQWEKPENRENWSTYNFSVFFPPPQVYKCKRQGRCKHLGTSRVLNDLNVIRTQIRPGIQTTLYLDFICKCVRGLGGRIEQRLCRHDPTKGLVGLKHTVTQFVFASKIKHLEQLKLCPEEGLLISIKAKGGRMGEHYLHALYKHHLPVGAAMDSLASCAWAIAWNARKRERKEEDRNQHILRTETRTSYFNQIT